MAEPKTKVVITVDCTVAGHEEEHSYKRGQKVSLRPDAARHLLTRGLAVDEADFKQLKQEKQDAAEPHGDGGRAGVAAGSDGSEGPAAD